jgi:hypothetical protein
LFSPQRLKDGKKCDMLSLQPPSGVVGGSGGLTFSSGRRCQFFLFAKNGRQNAYPFNLISITYFPQCRETPANEPLAMLVLVAVSLLPFTSILPTLRGLAYLGGDCADFFVYVPEHS